MEPYNIASTKDYSNENGLYYQEQGAQMNKREASSYINNNNSFLSESANHLKSNISVIGDDSYYNDSMAKMDNDQVNFHKENSCSSSSLVSDSQGDPSRQDKKKVKQNTPIRS